MLGRPIGGAYAAAEAYGAVLGKDINSKFLERLMFYHTLGELHLPFTGIWDQMLFDTSKINPDDNLYFVFYEGFRPAYSRNYLKHLRKKYKNCKLIHCFRNPVRSYHVRLLKRWSFVKDCFDISVTLNRADAEMLGIFFCDYWPCLLPEKDFEPENASDVFFVAQAKDRLPMILDVFERLSAAGLKCNFHITGVPESEQRYSDVIHYNRWISYDEVLQHVKNTKCVLEILPFGQHYSSLRVCEALWYHKKLLTTNLEAPQEWFYHPEIVQCFSKAQDIDTEFLVRPPASEEENRIFGQMKIGDFKIFASRLIELINKLC